MSNHAPRPRENDAVAPATAASAVAASSPGKASILLVDDRADKRLALSTVIASLGQNIVEATSGKEALRCLLQQEFAVILLDVNMPGMDGFETAHLIRQRRSSEHTPIIFITGISDTETHVSRGYSLGAVDYVLTPVLPEVLRTKVSVFVELYNKTEQIRQQAERLRLARDQLDVRVKERTIELGIANDSLKVEIAERRRAEAQVRKLNADLEQRVNHRTSELAAANHELEAFTYSVAHDLEAPLRHIQSYAELVQIECTSGLSAEARQYLDRITQRARTMGGMLEDLLKLSFVGKQDIHRQILNLKGTINRLIAGFNSDLPDRRIEWRVGPLADAPCDPGLMNLVLVNLLSNAIKYTRPRDPAIIEIGQTTLGSETCFFVRDNGVGFEMKDASKLFGVFQRLHPAEDFEGTGVGLAIATRIVHRHGGRIWAEGAVNQGATFYFTLDEMPPAPNP
jgi:two-component system, sensor histidine kinase and response regulator